MEGPAPMLQLRGVTKRFGSVVANDGVNLDIRPREIHALVGENGAGKSTLMNVLYGVLRPDAGTISVDGAEVAFSHPRDAIKRGIGMVHQHFMLVPSLTVLENLTLGVEPRRSGLFDAKRARAEVADSMARLGLNPDLDAATGSLGVASQQQLEIVKVIHRGASVVILDEPTAVLTPQETSELFLLLRRLASEGTAIVFISHKLREVFDLADRITVLREGRSTLSVAVKDTDPAAVAAAMTGIEDLNLGRLRAEGSQNDRSVVLDVVGLCADRPAHDAGLRDVTFQVREGEIVGIAAVEGNGQSTLVECLVGTYPVADGRVAIENIDVTSASIAGRRDAGLSYVPEDRQREGIPLHGSVVEAIIAGRVRRSSRSVGRAIDGELRRWATGVVKRYDIRTPSVDQVCSLLSGGNQQKIVLARELEEEPRLLVLAQPTRGVDIGAIDFLYRRIIEAAERGCAVLLVSADLDELLRLSDRILVMLDGRVVAERPGDGTSRDELGRHMTGGHHRAGAA